MDYIAQINNFWLFNLEYRFNAVDAYLYFYLLNVSNRLFWRNPFSHSNGQITAALGISEKTLIGAKQRLKEAGLIKFETGDSRRNSTKYYINPCKNSSSLGSSASSSLGGSLGSEKETPQGENPTAIIKHNTNNTIQLFEEDAHTPTQETSKKANKRFTPPSVAEVQEYCNERNNGINAQQFCDHYTANGWKQKGGNPIKDWRAAVRTWERNGINQPQHTTLEKAYRECEETRPRGTRHTTL